MPRPILYLAPVEWDGLRQRPHHLAMILARHSRVIYVNPVGLRSLRLGDVARVWRYVRNIRGPGALAPFRVVSPMFIPWIGPAPVRRLNERLLLRQVPVWLRGSAEFDLWVSTPSVLALTLLRHTRPSRVVYDCMDNYAAFHSATHASIAQADEEEVLKRADMVFASSRALADKLADRHGNVRLLPNGADVARFLRAGAPEGENGPPDLRGLDTPLVGYCGTIGDWIDFDLLDQVAESLSRGTLVLIGPWIARGGRRLLRRRNVRWLGEKDWADVPQYCREFSVGLIPFRVNDVGRYVNPIKLYEYLALGLPVVSTALPEITQHARHVSVAATAQEFVGHVAQSLHHLCQSEEARAVRSLYGASFSWDVQAVSLSEPLSLRRP